jgi:hypothetical protein
MVAYMWGAWLLGAKKIKKMQIDFLAFALDDQLTTTANF